MKYLIAIIGLVFVIAGCTPTEESGSDTNNETETASEEEGSIDNTKNENGENKTNLVLSKAFESEGQNADNNELVALAEQTLEDNPELGKESDVGVYYMANYNEPNQLYGVFLLTNYTGEEINDMTFDFSWKYEGEIIYENIPLTYTAEEMNTLPTGSAILLLLPVEEDKQELVNSIDDLEKVEFRLANIKVTN